MGSQGEIITFATNRLIILSMWKILSIPKAVAHNLKTLSSFLLVALLITLLTPGNTGFRYQFSKGKPWQYDLLTAPYDFPIYKSDAELSLEQDSIREATKPVYTYDEEIMAMMLGELKDDYEAHMSQEIPHAYYQYVQHQLRRLYGRGLIQAEQAQGLREQGKLEINLVGADNVMKRTPITRFYNLKEAYEQIHDNKPDQLSAEVLLRMDLARYLRDNVLLNEELTTQLIEAELSDLSPSVGLIQQGERIIDKGEIVTPYTYSLLRSLAHEQQRRSGGTLQQWSLRIGNFLSMSILFSVLGLYLILFIPSFVLRRKNLFFLLISLFLFVGLTAVNIGYDLFNLYIIPYVMFAIMMRTFFDSHTSLITYIVMVLSSAIFIAEPLGFILTQMVAGLVVLIALQNLSSRAQLIRASFLVYLSYTIMSLAITIMNEGSIQQSYWIIQLYFAINLIFLTFTYILAFIVEKTFGYVSNVSLVELSDVNTPLLKELSEVAPGTFQHSLQVSILATEAASKIGGDVQLIRTGALYHDIGKIKNPTYFTENQGVSNPHDLLSCDESAQIIIRHVTDGIALAQKHNLPPQIIDFIRTHHGEGMTRYFYNTYCNQHPDQVVDPTPFTYPGPNPWTKEQGILMLADAVEASSRSLKEHTEQGLSQLMNRIIDGIVGEGMLNNTPLTFRDIQVIKEVFLVKLKTMYHSRITYPDKR